VESLDRLRIFENRMLSEYLDPRGMTYIDVDSEPRDAWKGLGNDGPAVSLLQTWNVVPKIYQETNGNCWD
jgi:hypothetical protein